jgi:hypothetical protein
MRVGAMTAEINARRERDAGRCEPSTQKRSPPCRGAAIRVDEKASGRSDRDPEAEVAQCRHQVIASRFKFGPSRLEQRQRFGLEARQRGVLRQRRR